MGGWMAPMLAAAALLLSQPCMEAAREAAALFATAVMPALFPLMVLAGLPQKVTPYPQCSPMDERSRADSPVGTGRNSAAPQAARPAAVPPQASPPPLDERDGTHARSRVPRTDGRQARLFRQPRRLRAEALSAAPTAEPPPPHRLRNHQPHALRAAAALPPGGRKARLTALVFGWLAGSPASARQIAQRFSEGALTAPDAGWALIAAGVMSPMFFVGTLAQWLHNGSLAWVGLAAHWLSALAVAWLARRTVQRQAPAKAHPLGPSDAQTPPQRTSTPPRYAAQSTHAVNSPTPLSSQPSQPADRTVSPLRRTSTPPRYAAQPMHAVNSHTPLTARPSQPADRTVAPPQCTNPPVRPDRRSPDSACEASTQAPSAPSLSPKPPSPALLAALPEAIAAACRSLLSVCGAMMLFAVLAAMAREGLRLLLPAWTNAHPALLAAGHALLEIGGGSRAVVDALGALWTPAALMSLLCGLCSFGGLSIWLQNLAVAGALYRRSETRCSPAAVLGWRALHGLLAAGLCFLGCRLITAAGNEATMAAMLPPTLADPISAPALTASSLIQIACLMAMAGRRVSPAGEEGLSARPSTLRMQT